MNGETGYGYDLMIQPESSLTDARHKQTSFTYDPYRRVTKITYPGPAQPLPIEGVTYDPAGRLATPEGPQGVADHVCL